MREEEYFAKREAFMLRIARLNQRKNLNHARVATCPVQPRSHGSNTVGVQSRDSCEPEWKNWLAQNAGARRLLAKAWVDCAAAQGRLTWRRRKRSGWAGSVRR